MNTEFIKLLNFIRDGYLDTRETWLSPQAVAPIRRGQYVARYRLLIGDLRRHLARQVDSERAHTS